MERAVETGPEERMAHEHTLQVQPAGLFGLMAEFDSADQLLEATVRATAAGYKRVEAYSPFPVEGLAEALNFHTRLPLIVLIGGIIGGLSGFLLQYWISVMDYPINVGGRPLNSWPSFIPVTFELTILVAGLTAVIAMIALNGLPMPYHPVFNVPRFELASNDRFFLSIEATDPRFQMDGTRSFLEGLGAKGVYVIDE
jgi:hypothetical protein